MTSEQAIVRVTGAAQATVRVEQTATAKVVRVAVPGPQGPVRVGRVLVDASSPGTLLVGTAPLGTDEDADAWTITRSEFSAAGIRTSRGTASNVTWTGRTSHSYT